MTKKGKFTDNKVNCIEIEKGYDAQTCFTFHLRDVVDVYSYHDFPASETVYLSDEEVRKIIVMLNGTLEIPLIIKERSDIDPDYS